MRSSNTILLKCLSFLGLGFTIVPSFFVFYGIIALDLYKNLMLIGTFLWLLTAPFWINNEKA